MEFPHPSEINAARRRLVILLVIAALVITAAAYVSWPEGPSLQDRRLTDWLQDYSSPLRNVHSMRELNGHTMSQNMQTAGQVIESAGTNIIPDLLRLSAARDSIPRKSLLGLVARSPSLRSHFFSAAQKHQLAQTGFSILQQSASNAIPALTALTKDNDPEIRFGAFKSLFFVSGFDLKSLVPILVPFGHDPDFSTRAKANRQMQMLLPLLTDDEAQKAGVYEAFPEFRASNLSRSRANNPSSTPAPPD